MTKVEPERRHKYDVCLSFAGEDREYVRHVADALRESGARVFYDEHEEVELWGKDLYVHLDDVYKNAARYCVLFASRHYAEKLWTNHERRSAQERAFRENTEYLLPARFDDTTIPGVGETVGYIDLRGRTPREFAALILQKIGLVGRGNDLPHGSEHPLDEHRKHDDAIRTLTHDERPSRPPPPHVATRKTGIDGRAARQFWRITALLAVVAAASAVGLWLHDRPRSDTPGGNGPAPVSSNTPSPRGVASPRRTYAVSDRPFYATSTVQGARIRVPAGWKASRNTRKGVWTFRLTGTSKIVMTVVSPASFNFEAERRTVKARGYYKEVFYGGEQDGGRRCLHWQYHARETDQLRHVDVWYFPATSGTKGVLIRSEFPTYDQRDDSAEVAKTAVVVMSLRWPSIPAAPGS